MTWFKNIPASEQKKYGIKLHVWILITLKPDILSNHTVGKSHRNRNVAMPKYVQMSINVWLEENLKQHFLTQRSRESPSEGHQGSAKTTSDISYRAESTSSTLQFLVMLEKCITSNIWFTKFIYHKRLHS